MNTKICPQHGEYEFRYIGSETFGFRVESQCPKCAQEKKERYEREEKQEAERKEAARLQLWIERSRIPKIYQTSIFEPKPTQQIEPYNYDKNIILLGNVGSGKTKYACWLGIQAIKRKMTVRYQLSNELASRIKDTWGSKNFTEYEIIQDLSTCDLLIFDEIGRLDWTEWHFSIINNRYSNALPTILIGNLKPEELPIYLGEPVMSRLRGLGVVGINFGVTDYRKEA